MRWETLLCTAFPGHRWQCFRINVWCLLRWSSLFHSPIHSFSFDGHCNAALFNDAEAIVTHWTLLMFGWVPACFTTHSILLFAPEIHIHKKYHHPVLSSPVLVKFSLGRKALCCEAHLPKSWVVLNTVQGKCFSPKRREKNNGRVWACGHISASVCVLQRQGWDIT